MMFFEFDQNNSGGTFLIDDNIGIGPRVWIEAESAEHADEKAAEIGIYFNGGDDGRDCPCCGDRWYEARHKGVNAVEVDQMWDFHWHDTVYVHRADGSIERLKKGGSR